ncbi:MAG: hypothetical protein BRC25_00985 [Parcubacteria group bacterium SW_6_46_9]|nr:MAG: hypothetical protein BRC25_00985 [Parcubacteria group bacterium SW_6_46_9]
MRKTSNNNYRLILLAGVVVLAMLTYGVRLYSLQIVHGDTFQKQAKTQYTESDGPQDDRGTISLVTKDGKQRTAAYQKSGYELAVNGQTIANPAQAYEKITSLISLNTSKKSFIARTASTSDPYIKIKKRLPESAGEKINNKQIPGVNAYPQKWRQYPLGSLAAHTIGFVGFNKSTDYPTGIYGVEKYYNDILSRSAGSFYTNLFARVFSQPTETTRQKPHGQDGDVNLTIEPDVQSFLEQQLQKTLDRWQGRQAMGVIIEPDTGAIKGLGVTPSFNPNEYEQVANQSVFTNPTVQSRFEMGSIVKALTMSAGIDAGMQTVLNQSLNTGAAFVADRLGRKQMRSYFRDWFSGKTGIDLPGEVKNNTDNLSEDRDLEFATASFGQGISMTPIKTVQALSSLANGGQMVRPHVTDSIDYRLGGRSTIVPQDGERVISQETADTVSKMLVTVVDDVLDGGDRERKRHSIAAKTGTAQISNAQGEYYEHRFNHTFFGYFPAYEPEYLVFLMIREPQGVRFASQTLTDPFMNITDFLINYYNIPPDR